MNVLDWLDLHQRPDLEDPPIACHSFNYTAVLRALAAAVPTVLEVSTESDADFLWRTTTVQVERGGSVVTDPEITLQVIDTGSGRILMNTRDLALCAGTGQNRYVWPEPPIVQAGAILNLELTALTGAVDADLHFSLMGEKLLFRSDQLRMDFREGIVRAAA